MKLIFLLIPLFFSTQCQVASSPVTENEVIFGTIAGKSLKLEVANNPIKRAVGLMNRTSMGQDEGMLFVFPKPDFLSFWMKNTLIPLTVGFLSEDLVLIETHDMKPNQIREVYNSMKLAKYALEVNRDWFSKNKVPLESVLILEKKISAIE